MKVSQAIKQRQSTRAFTQQQVDINIIKDILDTAKFAPSGVNTQPWQVAVLSGQSKAELSNKMIEAFVNKQKEDMDYQYYPTEWLSPFKERRINTGLKLYQALDIKKEDKEKRLKQWQKNYSAFEAPVMLLFFIDKSLETGSYLDYGMFMQNVMLLAEEHGLSTCPQAALAEYPNTVKTFLNTPENWNLVGGMAIGYKNQNDPVNQYRTEREELEKFCQFYN